MINVSTSIRDWPEDLNQENGNYENKCIVCTNYFMGNKHRHECRVCSTRSTARGNQDVDTLSLYKKPRKHPKKDPYLSKPYRTYQIYLTQRYGNLLALLMVEHLQQTMNRDGFMRRFLTPVADRKPVAKPAETTKYLDYKAEVLPRSRYLAYTVPKGWVTWEEDQRRKEGSPSSKVSLPKTNEILLANIRGAYRAGMSGILTTPSTLCVLPEDKNVS